MYLKFAPCLRGPFNHRRNNIMKNLDYWILNYCITCSSFSTVISLKSSVCCRKCSKSVKADHIIQLAPNEGSKTLSLSPIPICSSLPKSDSSVLIAYGSGVLLKFETIVSLLYISLFSYLFYLVWFRNEKSFLVSLSCNICIFLVINR